LHRPWRLRLDKYRHSTVYQAFLLFHSCLSPSLHQLLILRFIYCAAFSLVGLARA
jgi:hypothetical protein